MSHVREPANIKGAYGPVRVTKGPHAGKVGYYDDTDTDEKTAVVYFGTPFESPYFMIPLTHLEKAENSLLLERWVRENPALADMLGVNSRRDEKKNDVVA